MCNVLRLQQTPCIPSERKSRAARPQTFSPPSSVASAFKERKKCFCKIQFCLSLPSPPFRPFNWLTSADICILPQFFGDFCSFRLSPPLNDPTDEPGPFSGEFQLFALHISPTFASNLKSCSRQIQNLFQKNRTPSIFQLCARARGLNSQFSMVRLTIFKRKNKMS